MDKEKNNTNYISLQESTKHCNYSQEYLSLRARQGKLKAVKIGRNWVTKKKWIEEYLAIFGNGVIEKVERPIRPEIIKPPENLPVETALIKFSILSAVELLPKIRWGFVAALAFVLMISGFFIFWQVQPKVSFGKTATIVVTIDSEEIKGSVVETFKDYGQWLKSKIPEIKIAYSNADDFAKEKILKGYKIITRSFIKIQQLAFSPRQESEIKEEPKEEPEMLETTKEGMVVLPSTDEDGEIIKKIKESFSDEVRVEPKDETSGIIVPIFREREGQEYLYIMVPMKN